ncbi:hypothetical protein [Nocardia rhizosphaerae]|uniref:Uncharacterized protein n=1 Tax=Nocardia rhizosphaerae TaxID=1691571 RepID=A0ABV8KYQ5_9NOCA
MKLYLHRHMPGHHQLDQNVDGAILCELRTYADTRMVRRICRSLSERLAVSVFEPLFIWTEGSPLEVGLEIGKHLGMSVRTDADRVFLARPARRGKGFISGRVYINDFPCSDDGPEEVAAYDGYRIVFDMWAHDRSIQQAEALDVLNELSSCVPSYALLLTHDLQTLATSYLPGRGIHHFPAGTTPDYEDIEVWRDWVLT